jgi:hypothetical protein
LYNNLAKTLTSAAFKVLPKSQKKKRKKKSIVFFATVFQEEANKV